MMSDEKQHKVKNIFVQGPIAPQRIADMLSKHAQQTDIGAHQLFLGQIRADEKEGTLVRSIEYSAYEEMANQTFYQIKQEMFARYELTCAHVIHSLGKVKAGELSLLVFVSAPHRKSCIAACAEMVERIKNELPVWGKETFENSNSVWKRNR